MLRRLAGVAALVIYGKHQQGRGASKTEFPLKETFSIFGPLLENDWMNPKFEVLFLEEAREFLRAQDEKTRTKILYNVDKSRILNDPRLFKKLIAEIWEFRTKYGGLQYRLLAFWDKNEKTETLVICTHGFVKKVDKVSATEIDKADRLRQLYFDQRKRGK